MSRSNQPQTPGGSNRPHSDSAKPRKYTRYSDGTRRASTSSNVSIRSAAASGTSIVETPPSASQSSAQELSHAISTNEPNNTRLASLQDALDTLYDEWMSVEIVFQSIQTAFPVTPLAPLSYEERLDDVDRELSIAYDDLMVQVRRIHRNLNRLSSDMAHFRATKLHNQHASSSSSSEQQPQDRAHDDNSNGRTTASQ